MAAEKMQTLPCSMKASITQPSFPFFGEDSTPLNGRTFLAASPPPPPPSGQTFIVVDDKNLDWSPDLSKTLYRIDKWGPPYFSVNSSGSISVLPYGSSTLPNQEIDLLKVVKKVSDPESDGGLGLQLPITVQFPEVLKHRLEYINATFQSAIKYLDYNSHYQGVFPVKVNQHRFIVEDIVKFGYPFKFGLEAGSKPEILLALSCLSKGHPDSFLVCNGFKDSEFIFLALTARKLGFNTFIVLEQEEEVDIVIELSKKLDIQPVIGVRAKLKTTHQGHFEATSGEKGKFGLTSTEIMHVVAKLTIEGMLSCLKLLHFHIGSQIPTTKELSEAVKEASQIYCALAQYGAPMQIIDIGGGLGIDYDGSRSKETGNSVEYTLEEYAEAVVKSIRDVCDKSKIKHPVICSESGRAIVSHQSILVFEVISSRYYVAPKLSASGLKYLVEGFSKDVREHYDKLHAAAVRGEKDICLHHTKQLKQLCLEQFKQGSMRIEHLAAVDGLCKLVYEAIGEEDPQRYYQINLSMFASIPDYLIIGQLFPIVPIHRLEERPTVTGILSDLTCDSDGRITKFIIDKPYQHLHKFKGGDDGKYYLGMFLGGAYEETIGGLHNLFGTTTVVQVESSTVGDGFKVKRSLSGQSCRELLQRMAYDPDNVFQTIKQRAGANKAVDSLARFFDKMPYLASSPSFVDNAFNKN